MIHIHVPSSGEVHSFKKRIYDRVDEADVKVTATAKIAQMYIRKQEIYTERTVYPFVKLKDLRLDLLPMVRILAKNNAGGSHLWEKLSNMDLLKSAGLYAEDHATGKDGFNLAAVMLLGRDEVIRDVCPAYQTDALVRKVNVDRYDDRLTVVTNLIESFEQLFKFATLHLPDKFYVEGAERKSLRNIVAREMLVNTLMHREYSSSYQAKFVIEQDRMYVENANRARFNGSITLRNLEPFPKNPLIASFFRNIGYSEKLGSGARKMFKYGCLYSGVDPEFIEDDVFRIIQPLNENYSFDSELFVRMAQCSALFPMMQFSKAPWEVLDKEYNGYVKEAAKIHLKFSDYIVSEVKKSEISGEPVLRCMEYQYPGCEYERITDQFMVGDKLLVAPVVKKGETVKKVVFPKGEWIAPDKTKYIGPCEKFIKSDIDTLLYFEKSDK